MSSFFMYHLFMNTKIQAYKELAKIFQTNGYNLYLVGGAVRDYLLNIELTDMDVATDATPKDILGFFDGRIISTFSKFGALTIYFNDVKFDVTTLREEKKYIDNRHPAEIVFIKDIKKDSIRRDFTINAMYMNKELELFDYVGGQKDLLEKTIRMIGDPLLRIQEDPLRIYRAIRFALTYSFHLDKELLKAIKESVHLINKLNPEKIKQEINKMHNIHKEYKVSLLNEIGVISFIDMLK